MKVKKCRICKSTNIKKLFSLGDMCFTGKFPSINQKIEKKPVTLIICKNCELVQLGHNFDLKYWINYLIMGKFNLKINLK